MSEVESVFGKKRDSGEIGSRMALKTSSGK